MNVNIPTIHCYVRREFLTNFKDTGLEEGYIFGITSYKGWAIMFNVLLKSGAHFRFIPLHAVITKDKLPDTIYELTNLQLWDCFSSNANIIVFDILKDSHCNAYLRNKSVVTGKYLFTIDWLPDKDEVPGFIYQPDQNKCGHIIELSNGQLACLPTNRVAFKDGYFIGNDPKPENCGYVTGTSKWSAETSERWSVADDDNTFYLDTETAK
jgi:hypothetical protein